MLTIWFLLFALCVLFEYKDEFLHKTFTSGNRDGEEAGFVGKTKCFLPSAFVSIFLWRSENKIPRRYRGPI